MAIRPRATGEVRISFGALLRVAEDERYILFHSTNRPGSWGPPGGVFKYFQPAGGLLERFGFRPQRFESLADLMRDDLRGFLPGRQLPRLLSWFDSGAYREDSSECLRRELVEELTEVGLPNLVPAVRTMSFKHVRTVTEGPTTLPGEPYRQLRLLEVHDLLVAAGAIARVRRELFEAGADPATGTVICASADDIRHGRCGTALIGGNSGYLLGRARTSQELPPRR